MNTIKNKVILSTVLSLAFIIGSGILLGWTINSLYETSNAIVVISLVLVSVFLYVVGASLAQEIIMGKSVNRDIIRRNHGGISNRGVISALLLIAAGILLLCFNTGVFAPVWKDFFFSWPMLLFIFGVIHICKCQFILGIILAAIGKYFLFSKISAIYPDTLVYEQFLSTYWPMGIILLGVLIFLSIMIRPKRCRNRHSKGNCHDAHTGNEQENLDGKINYQFIFSGTEQVILDPEFKGGSIETIFGGTALDLRQTSLPEGETFLYVNAIFGGIEITAPDHWDIEIRFRSIVGGVSDSRAKNVNRDQARKLILVAKCTFAGIEIK